MTPSKFFSKFPVFFSKFCKSYLPNKNDNIKQIIIKLFFIISLIALIASSIYLLNYFLAEKKQNDMLEVSRKSWHSAQNQNVSEPPQSILNMMLKENDEFKGWITIPGTQVDNPIYQAKDNDFYLNHDQKKESSAYGALFFDCNNIITAKRTDNNLVIFGHDMRNGSMFGTLKKYRNLDFYKENTDIEFSTLYKTSTYRIFAVYVLNAVPEDDNNRVFDIYGQYFGTEENFNNWIGEIRQRSFIDTGVSVNMNDNIITLVTCCEDFKNARLIVMAKECISGEDDGWDVTSAKVNPSPRYPERWYKNRKLKFPYSNPESSSASSDSSDSLSAANSSQTASGSSLAQSSSSDVSKNTSSSTVSKSSSGTSKSSSTSKNSSSSKASSSSKSSTSSAASTPSSSKASSSSSSSQASSSSSSSQASSTPAPSSSSASDSTASSGKNVVLIEDNGSSDSSGSSNNSEVIPNVSES